ncbi:hypothetical protein PLESTF_000686100 [Pleodorina starrii]|nr:hypothetical protein PLESTF_000686100 [Pleodorina starrii]
MRTPLFEDLLAAPGARPCFVTRQALGLGARDFHPTCLEAEHRAVHEASVYGNQLHTLERSLAKWSASTEDLMNAAGRFLADAPRPRRFAQSDLSDPTTLTAAPPSLPPEFERLNSPSLVRRLAAGTPLAVTDMVRLGLAEPIAVWLAALDAGKERLARLERQRLRYDAARRALHGAARAPGADEVGSAAHTHLIQLEQEHEPVMSEFRDELEALDRHLVWLADGGARLKATLVSALQCVNSAALRGALMPPEGLMVGFPRDLLERPETLRAAAAAAAAPAGPGAAAAAVETAAAMSDAAVEAATAAAITAAGLDVPPPQLVMLGPEAPTAPAGAAAIGGGVTDVVLIVPPGTAGVAAEAAVEAAEAVGFAAAQGAALAAPRGLLQEERKEEVGVAGRGDGGGGGAAGVKI